MGLLCNESQCIAATEGINTELGIRGTGLVWFCDSGQSLFNSVSLGSVTYKRGADLDNF